MLSLQGWRQGTIQYLLFWVYLCLHGHHVTGKLLRIVLQKWLPRGMWQKAIITIHKYIDDRAVIADYCYIFSLNIFYYWPDSGHKRYLWTCYTVIWSYTVQQYTNEPLKLPLKISVSSFETYVVFPVPANTANTIHIEKARSTIIARGFTDSLWSDY